MMNHSLDLLALCLAAEDYPHLMEEPEYQKAKSAVEASPELQQRLKEARSFFDAHPVLLDTSRMPSDVRARISEVLASESSFSAPAGERIPGPWEVRRNFAWAACLVLLLAGMALVSSTILEQRDQRERIAALTEMPAQDAFHAEVARLVQGGLSLQERSADATQLISWLGNRGVDDIEAPQPLLEIPSLGCAQFETPVGRIGVVCFNNNGDILHLFVACAREMNIEAELPLRFIELRGRNAKEWSDEENLYLLIPQEPQTDLPEIFL